MAKNDQKQSQRAEEPSSEGETAVPISEEQVEKHCSTMPQH
jgi:hypothetical protein